MFRFALGLQGIFQQATRSSLALCLYLLLQLCTSFLHAETLDLNQNWEYRWGDSPFQNGVPTWTLEPAPEAWKPIDFPSNPPGRDGREQVWYRTLIPDADWRDPVLYIFSVDLITEVYIDGQQIYHYGEFDAQGRGQFEGWPWHMITLPEDAAGKPIYFRVFSNYLDIGLWGEVKVMERTALYQRILEGSMHNLAIGAFSLIIALLCLLFAPFNSERMSLLSLALFSLSHAGLSIGASQAKQLLLNAPLVWEYISAGCYYLMPVALALLLRSWYGDRYRKLFNHLTAIFTLYFVGALGLSLLGVISLANTYPPFDVLFAIFVPSMLVVVARHWPLATRDQRLLVLATGVLTMLLLLDMAVAHNFLPWIQVPVDLGSLIFSLAIVVMSLNHFSRTHQSLARLNMTLESRVAERTQALEQMAKREAQRVKALEFANLKRSMMDELVNEMEALPDPEQALTCLCRSIDELCAPIPGAIYCPAGDNPALQQHSSWGDVVDFPEYLGIDREANLKPQLLQLNVQYDTPMAPRKMVATLLLDFSEDSALVGELSRTTLEALYMRAIERINLTLSKVALQQLLNRFSYEDALTELHNRRYLDQMLTHELARGERTQTEIALVICDIDHFKQLNDNYGHAAGDHVLQIVAQQLRQAFRSSDIICRYGGEEFVVVLPDTCLEDARVRAEQLRTSMAAKSIVIEGDRIGSVTLSAGVSSGRAGTIDADTLLQQADQALYRAKQSGRNRVLTAPDEGGDPDQRGAVVQT
ncbi:GGDEF domain-containing protein [Marinobacterium stanieri]|uniref:GGDEF domain-containing protein n=1 Tax=Marinobacterium stanieri TaxID=49186 RepID=UPI0002558C16|nr:GGDEF domain-containing protein [Marinobacterium stanieri]